MSDRKGIILAGGSGTRLHPSTISVSKQLIPVFDKPMIYYPLAVLMMAGINEVLIITTPNDVEPFERLMGDGSAWGIRIEYAVQPSPDGLAQALIIGEDFLDGSPSVLILGDNLFFGDGIENAVKRATASTSGATVFGYKVKNPQEYGVVGFDENMVARSLEEKPKNPKSNYAVTGLYFYDENASTYAKNVVPSDRGELEITSLNEMYLDNGTLNVEILSAGTTWLDTGTHRSMLKAAEFVSIIEERQGQRICCPEAISYQQGWIDKEQLVALAQKLLKSGYGKYLLTLVE